MKQIDKEILFNYFSITLFFMQSVKKLTFLCLVLSTFLLGNYACKTTKTNQLSYGPLEKSLLWEIKGPGIQKPSYLYGTIHLINGEDFFLPKGVMTAFDQSKKIVFEIDMKEMTDMSKIMGMMNKIFMKDNQTLKDLLSEEDYKLVGDHFQKMGLPIFMLERMKPMFLTVFASADMNPSSLKDGKMKSYEMEFMDMANHSAKTTGGLESIDFQIGLFDEIPYDAQAKMLVETIKSSGNTESDELKKLTDIYLRQDINAMVALITEEGSELAGLEDKLLNQRNKNWIPLMIEASKKEATFFAVGAGHLGGPEGVIHLLRKSGYQVSPIK
jgi:uncharacterized protein